jgi:hypothetical protein
LIDLFINNYWEVEVVHSESDEIIELR